MKLFYDTLGAVLSATSLIFMFNGEQTIATYLICQAILCKLLSMEEK